MSQRSDLLDRVSREYSESPGVVPPICNGQGRRLPSPAEQGIPKPGWMGRRLEEMGEPPMTEAECANWLGRVTVTPQQEL